MHTKNPVRALINFAVIKTSFDADMLYEQTFSKRMNKLLGDLFRISNSLSLNLVGV